MTRPSARAILFAKVGYVSAARHAGRALVRVHALPVTAPDPAQRIRHWVLSLVRIHDPVAMAELNVPWWTYSAVGAVDAWLVARSHPIRVFEYGSGASTVWLAQRADAVHSVEHDRAFAATFDPVLAAYDSVTLHVVVATPDAEPMIGSAKEGHQGLDFADYVATIDEVGGTFDLIVIDGRAREACLPRAVARLADDGLIVFDNSRRRRYRRAIFDSGLHECRFRGLTPALPYPDQTSLLTTRG